MFFPFVYNVMTKLEPRGNTFIVDFELSTLSTTKTRANNNSLFFVVVRGNGYVSVMITHRPISIVNAGLLKSAYFVCFVQDTNQRTRFEVVEHFVPLIARTRRKVENCSYPSFCDHLCLCYLIYNTLETTLARFFLSNRVSTIIDYMVIRRSM